MTEKFAPLLALATEEVVTHSFVRDARVSAGTIALVTLDNGKDHTRPNTLGPLGLLEFAAVLDEQRDRASRGEIVAVAVTGKQFIFAAGADLSQVGNIPDYATGRLMAELGHYALGKLSGLGVPSFVFFNGLALGGGLEIGLNASYRTVDASAAALALPEVSLGIVPAWGGAWLLPNLIGIENAIRVIIENPLKQRTLSARDASDLGIVDAIFPPARFIEDSLKWASDVLSGKIAVKRPHEPGALERALKWDIAIRMARSSLEQKIGSVVQSPYAALDLLSKAKKVRKDEGFAAEDDTLAELVAGDQFRASIYAFNLVQKRAKKPAGAPEKSLAKPVTQVGVIGAGLMARQFALLFVRRLRVPVTITDLDQSRVDEGVAWIRQEIETLHRKGRISSDESNRLSGLVRGTTKKSDFANCDWVIEAIFEELEAKQKVFAEVEQYVSADAVLATNTSSLSVDAIGDLLHVPHRLVGFHFFNPVAVMPLIEVVKAPKTDDATLATAMATAAELRKTAVITRDTPGFVVNRILARLLGEAMHAVDSGTSFEVVSESVSAFGLPMNPFELLELVGLTVGSHVLDTHHAAFPDRFHRSENLTRLAGHGKILERNKNGMMTGYDQGARTIVAGGTAPATAEDLRLRVEDALADEVHRMLSEEVVAAPEDIDLCMILGAGWPFQMGGITPYLDRVGASQRVFGTFFHNPPIRGVLDRTSKPSV